jgi:hypothetical protein
MPWSAHAVLASSILTRLSCVITYRPFGIPRPELVSVRDHTRGSWTAYGVPRGPALLVCDCEEIPAALRTLPDQVQLIGWGRRHAWRRPRDL